MLSVDAAHTLHIKHFQVMLNTVAHKHTVTEILYDVIPNIFEGWCVIKPFFLDAMKFVQTPSNFGFRVDQSVKENASFFVHNAHFDNHI